MLVGSTLAGGGCARIGAGPVLPVDSNGRMTTLNVSSESWESLREIFLASGACHESKPSSAPNPSFPLAVVGSSQPQAD